MAADLPSTMAIAADAKRDVVTVTASGVLDGSTYLRLRDAIIKAALEEPAAVIVDVTRLDVPAPSAWAVFTSARWHVSVWPDVPIALVTGHDAGRRAAARNGVTRYVPIYSNFGEAMLALEAAEPAPIRRRATALLPARIFSLSRAREVITEWLTAWLMTDFIPTCKVIVTTLVENVLAHTESEPQVRLETNGTTVTIAVSDENHTPAAPREEPLGLSPLSGLGMLAALCRAWGNAPTPSGKTVWAVVGPENRL